MVVEYISVTSECRRLARNVVTNDFTDPEIISYQKKRYSYIALVTDKDDWVATDREFGALQLVETNLVAADIVKHFGEVQDIPIWQAMIADAKDDLFNEESGIIPNMDTEIPETESEVDRTEFKGWGLNTNLSPPNRLTRNVVADTESF